MSSSNPFDTRMLARDRAPRDVMVLDAPVSGGVARARAGTLTIMIGGDDPAAVERVRPLLACMGNRLFDTGALGLLAKDVAIAAELGRAVGLDAPLTRVVCKRWKLARKRLGAERDNSEAILSWDVSTAREPP